MGAKVDVLTKPYPSSSTSSLRARFFGRFRHLEAHGQDDQVKEFFFNLAVFIHIADMQIPVSGDFVKGVNPGP